MRTVPELSILVVAHEAHRELDELLADLVEHPPALAHEILVVDNASTDGTAAVLPAKVRLLENRTNLGFARAVDQGFAATTGPLVLLLNPDLRLPDGAIDRLVAELARHPEAAVVGPRLVDAEGRAELSHGRLPSPWRDLGRKLLRCLREGRLGGALRRLAEAWVERVTRKAGAADWVSGACLLVRRDAAEAAGLFDERFFLYFEDIDFCAAVRRRGDGVRFAPDIEVVHRRGASSRHAPAAARRAFREAQLLFYRKHRPRWVRWLRLYQRRGDPPPAR